MGKKYGLKATMMILAVVSVGSAVGDGGKIWSQYDVDQDGYLNLDEFTEMRSRQPSPPEYEAVWRFGRVDVDDNGLVDQAEMLRALQEQARVKNRAGKY